MRVPALELLLLVFLRQTAVRVVAVFLLHLVFADVHVQLEHFYRQLAVLPVVFHLALQLVQLPLRLLDVHQQQHVARLHRLPQHRADPVHLPVHFVAHRLRLGRDGKIVGGQLADLAALYDRRVLPRAHRLQQLRDRLRLLRTAAQQRQRHEQQPERAFFIVHALLLPTRQRRITASPSSRPLRISTKLPTSRPVVTCRVQRSPSSSCM